MLNLAFRLFKLCLPTGQAREPNAWVSLGLVRVCSIKYAVPLAKLGDKVAISGNILFQVGMAT